MNVAKVSFIEWVVWLSEPPLHMYTSEEVKKYGKNVKIPKLQQANSSLYSRDFWLFFRQDKPCDTFLFMSEKQIPSQNHWRPWPPNEIWNQTETKTTRVALGVCDLVRSLSAASSLLKMVWNYKWFCWIESHTPAVPFKKTVVFVKDSVTQSTKLLSTTWRDVLGTIFPVTRVQRPKGISNPTN